MSSFKDLRIVDNFYQTSAFFPMPTIMVGTLTDDGKTTFGPYSCLLYTSNGYEKAFRSMPFALPCRGTVCCACVCSG